MKFLKGFRFDPLNVVDTVAGILGERDTTNETRQKLQDMDYPHIRDLLPYQDYDSESQIWVNKESVGFVIESQPLIGANEKLAESLEYLLRDVAPRDVPLQVMLVSSRAVKEQVEQGLKNFAWKGHRADECNDVTARFYLNGARYTYSNGLDHPLTLRDYRVFFVWGMPVKRLSETDLVRVRDVRRNLLNALNAADIWSEAIGVTEFSSVLREFFNHDPARLERYDSEYDPAADLNTQFVDRTTSWRVKPSHIRIEGSDRDSKPFAARMVNLNLDNNPQEHYLWQNGNIFQDLMAQLAAGLAEKRGGLVVPAGEKGVLVQVADADRAVSLIDVRGSTQFVSDLNSSIMGMAKESGRPLVVVAADGAARKRQLTTFGDRPGVTLMTAEEMTAAELPARPLVLVAESERFNTSGLHDVLKTAAQHDGTTLVTDTHARRTAGFASGVLSSAGVKQFTPLDEATIGRRLEENRPVVSVTQGIKSLSGESDLTDALRELESRKMSQPERAMRLAIEKATGTDVTFTGVRALAGVINADRSITPARAEEELSRLVQRGEILELSAEQGAAGKYISRENFENEVSILRHVAEGKNSVKPLLAGGLSEEKAAVLTEGQREAGNLILTTRDRFTAIQGYAGVGKTTQFRTVAAALAAAEDAPDIRGLAPTHRAVSELSGAGGRVQGGAAGSQSRGKNPADGNGP